MTNQEILTKAFEKAIADGWDEFDIKEFTLAEFVDGVFNEPREWFGIFEIVYSHNFAKALWGDKPVIDRRVPTNPFADEDDHSMDIVIIKDAWKHHLQQMVIAEDPIRYLGEHI